MKLSNLGRGIALMTILLAGVFWVNTTVSSAAVRSVAPHSQHSIHAKTPPPPAPSGCNPGYFCSYNEGNGGDLCFQKVTTGNYPTGCADANDGAFNNSSESVKIYYEFNESGAYYLLGPGDFLLYMTQNDFNQCDGGGTSCAGYGQPMGNNAESVKFV